MPKRRKFTKVYFICEDNSVLSKYEFVNCYKRREYAESVCKSKRERNKADQSMLHPTENHTYTVHAFYIIHESLF